MEFKHALIIMLCQRYKQIKSLGCVDIAGHQNSDRCARTQIGFAQPSEFGKVPAMWDDEESLLGDGWEGL